MIKFTLTLATALVAWLPTAHAQSEADVLRRALEESMPAVIGKDNSELAAKLLSIKPDGAISRSFDAAKVSRQLFGPRARPNSALDCSVLQTAQKEADSGLCIVDVGRRDDETGAYSMLAYSKNIGLGDVKYFKRAAFKGDGSVLPAETKLSDASAYNQALKFLELIGVPKSEIPVAPAGAKNPYSVRSLIVGGGTERADPTLTKTLRKVVSIQRSFTVPGGIYTDPSSGIRLEHAIAPGHALVVVNDEGVQLANIQKWSDAQIDTTLSPKRAKSLDQLLDEISEDLYNEGVRNAGTLSILIGLRQGYPHPDDPNPVFCPVCGVLRPALIVTVAQADRGPIKASADNFITAGLVREYDLIEALSPEQGLR